MKSVMKLYDEVGVRLLSIKKVLLKMAGKTDFELDSRISMWYIVRTCWIYGWMMVRGILRSIGYKDISSSVFIGKAVKLYEKRYLKIGKKVKLRDGVKIDALSTDGVKIGDYCILGKNTAIECTGSLSAIGKGVEIGNCTTFGGDCFFGAAGGIKIGNDVVAGQYIRFHSENHNYERLDIPIREQGVTHEGIEVGDNCWIGSGVVFLDGARVGNGCVIAANAVVTKQFPDNVIIGGIPAKIIKKREQDE